MDTAVLNPVTLPLNKVCLIEASAGTGKTYTIGSLYLRLLLQAGENGFSQPLTVEQILVVTFTEAATEELKGRIRERIHQAKKALLAYQEKGEVALLQSEPLLLHCIDSISAIQLAIQRLNIAEQTMDLAAIYTIHGFCRRMLMQYAFHSQIHFNLTLNTDETLLLERLFKAFWREHFYCQPFLIANYIHQTLGSPHAVFAKLRQYIAQDLRSDPAYQDWLAMSLQDFLQQHIVPQQQRIHTLKQQWLAQEAEIQALVLAELDKTYAKGEKKRLKRTTFKKPNVLNWFNAIHDWASSPLVEGLNDKLSKYFSQHALNGYAEDGAEPLCHAIFALVDEANAQQDRQPFYAKLLHYYYLRGVQQALIEYKAQHTEKNFDDLLRLLREALYSAQGEELAQFIRVQYPFAMIDEFQDTDAQQYQIFAKIYLHQDATETGFIMIGDPKQAIYKFRGADIFTYFQAAEQADARFTLGTNWRSAQRLVKAINGLFQFEQGVPFLYPQIQFLPVAACPDKPKFLLNGQEEPAFRCYVGDVGEVKKSTGNLTTTQKQTLASICAQSIQYWLQSAVQDQAIFYDDQATNEQERRRPLRAEKIAVLVKDWKEASLVSEALQQLGIASVYLSDKSNVFDCHEAKELVMILTACLQPFSERNILNAIATRIFGLTTREISEIKQDEQRWTQVVERFVNYQRIWQWQGILVMLHRLFLDENIMEKLLSQLGGERKTTDLLHLAELLQEASTLNDSAASLLRWFEKQIQGENRQDGQQIRLESERQLVKIVTIHKSKGLEYDLVWLPFIADAPKENKAVLDTYYDHDRQQILWDLEATHQDAMQQEQRAEAMRLFYVALTRAKYQVAMALPEFFVSDWNCLQYALTQGEMRQADVRSALNAFQQRIADPEVKIQVDEFDAIPRHESALMLETTSNAPLQCAEFQGNIERNWQVTSFSAISALHEKNKQLQTQGYLDNTSDLSLLLDHKDYDVVLDFDTTVAPVAEIAGYAKGYTPFDFPAGTMVGKVLHRYFEKYPLNQAVDSMAVAQMCQTLQLEEVWHEPLQSWLTTILHTPLLSDKTLSLSDLSAKDCIKEMAFYLKFKHEFQAHKFNQLLQKYHFISAPLQLQTIKQGIAGLLRGFIDLVFRHNGQYYLVDYKSNKLGTNPSDYAPENLQNVMLAQHYDWQYLFYTLALHRYLKQRDPHYTYATHFGGVIYTFLRGMNGIDQQGIYFQKPDANLIQELEELF
ncbi:exodeoxyribonuclease V subunit beta [Bisgaard Taxon 45]